MVKKPIIPFNYFGGKFNHVNWVLKHLPESYSYVEVFGGSAVILLNKKPSRIETYNDINGRVVNFFEQLRINKEELIDKIYLTPYSREEYFKCYKNLNVGDELERARKFFVVVNQSFNGTTQRQTGWKMSTKESRALISEALSRWLTKIPNLIKVIERMRNVQITNYDFRVIFEKFDSSRTLFYCDPPYILETRCNKKEYEFEMNDKDHSDFLEICKTVKGKVAISHYENSLYEKELSKFYKSTAKKKRTTLFHSMRQEILYTNYDPLKINSSLFNQ